jgi:hypothetical protein
MERPNFPMDVACEPKAPNIEKRTVSREQLKTAVNPEATQGDNGILGKPD